MEESLHLLQRLNGGFAIGVADAAEVLPLTDEDGHGDTGGKAGGDGVGDVLNKTAETAQTHHHKDDARHDGSQHETGHTLLRHDACHDGGEGGGRACDLHRRAAEEGDKETSHNGGVDTLLGTHAAGQRQCNGQGQGDDRHNDTGDDILHQLLTGISLQAGEEHGSKVLHILDLTTHNIRKKLRITQTPLYYASIRGISSPKMPKNKKKHLGGLA